MATFNFTTTADEDAALAALGLQFETSVRAHLRCLVSNHHDLRFDQIKRDFAQSKDKAAVLAKLEAEAKK